jgi:hypothetical protein
MTEELSAPPGRPAPTLEYAPRKRKRATWKLTRVEVGVAVAMACLLSLTLLPSLDRSRHDPHLKCAANLRVIAQAVEMYAVENRGVFPPDVPTLVATQNLVGDHFVCYRTGDGPAVGASGQALSNQLTAAAGHLSYVYCGAGMNDKAPASTVIAYEPLANHGDGMWVAYADTKVEWLDAKRGRKLIAELAAGVIRRGGEVVRVGVLLQRAHL